MLLRESVSGADVGIQSIRVNNTTVRNGTGTGIYAGAYGGSSVTVEVKNNTVSGNGSVGIYIDGRTSGSVIKGEVSGNTVTNQASNYGIHVYTYNYGRAEMNILNNTVSGSKDFGIYLMGRSRTERRARIGWPGTVCTGPAGREFTYGYYSDIDAAVEGNEVYQNTYGISVEEEYSNRTMNITVAGNVVHDNSQRGVYLYAYADCYMYAQVRGNKVYRKQQATGWS